jgi:hypothetical protein
MSFGGLFPKINQLLADSQLILDSLNSRRPRSADFNAELLCDFEKIAEETLTLTDENRGLITYIKTLARNVRAKVHSAADQPFWGKGPPRTQIDAKMFLSVLDKLEDNIEEIRGLLTPAMTPHKP